MKSANSMERTRKGSSFNGSQPPPYQDEGTLLCSSRPRPEQGLGRGSSSQRYDSPCCSSEASVDPDMESYLNKGCEEDIPSDSTAVVGTEVSSLYSSSSQLLPQPLP